MLNKIDNVIEWMNKVKEHGGVEKAEAARIAAGEGSRDDGTPEQTRRPVITQALQSH